MTAYYNEIDPYAAQWLRNLIKAGHIAPGFVDERSILDVMPDDLREFTQCHFFAGVGVWSYALRRAGWPDDRPVWSGSCPCQPFSAAGKGTGFDDERHLWPAFFHLISQRRPATVLGEQVASKDADPWLDLVSTDLESLGLAFGAVAFPSAGVGAPHIRDRTYWVAHASGARLDKRQRICGISGGTIAAESREAIIGNGVRNACGLADAVVAGLGVLGRGRQFIQGDQGPHPDLNHQGYLPGPVNGHWRAADWLACRDGKWRPVEPGTFPLAHGATSRVGRLRAYGNAINASAAEVFIRAYLEG